MSPAEARTNRLRLVAAFAAVYLIWGSTYLAIRYAIETLPPLLMAGVRFIIAGGILYGWSRLRGVGRPERIQWRSAAIIGGLLLLGGNGGVVLAERTVPSGLTALIVAMVPLWIALLEWFRPGGRRPGWQVAFGLLAGSAGLVILIGPATASLGERVDPLGALILLVATISWSIGSVHSRSANLPSSPLLGTGMEMLCGGVLLLMAGAATGEIAAVDPSAVSLRSVVALAYLIVFGALLGFTAYIYLLKAAGPTRAATYAYVNPVVAVFLGWALAGEAITVRTIIASVAIIGAVVLITSAGRGPARLARPFRAVFRKAA